MKNLILGIVTSSVLTSQAFALSCAPPNIARTFNYVNDAPDTFYMGLGTLSATGKIPKYVEGTPRQIPAQFEGVFMSATGQTETKKVDVILDAICFASWCGGFPETDDEMVVFLKQTNEGYRLESNPCDGHFKVMPTPKELRVLKRCLGNSGCTDLQIKSLDSW